MVELIRLAGPFETTPAWASPSDASMLDIAGFDAVPNLIAGFSRGEV